MKVEQHHKALLRILGNKNIREYDETDITKAGKAVRKWPKNATSRKDLDYLNVDEIIARTDLGEALQPSSVKSRLTQLNSIFKFALARGLIDRSPCPKWLFEEDQQINDQGELVKTDRHLPWSIDEILRLLGSSYFVKPVHRRKTPENFWLPLMALFTGCRLNELCQLYCDDILFDEANDVWVIRVVRNKKRRQSTKNVNSIRRVPVHKTLMGLGLLGYRDHVANEGERLFPNLPYFDTVENYSNGWSKRFGHHVKRHMQWDDPATTKVFHGFRAAFIRTLRDAGNVPMERIQYITGHASQHKMVDLYGGTPPVVILDGATQQLDYGVDFIGQLGHWDDWHK